MGTHGIIKYIAILIFVVDILEVIVRIHNFVLKGLASEIVDSPGNNL